MAYSQNVLNVLTCLTYKGIGNAWVVKNILPEEEIRDLVEKLSVKVKDKMVTIEGFKKRQFKIEAYLKQAMPFIDGVVAYGDNDFPKYYGKVRNSDKPVILFYKGDISLLSSKNKNIAVIGLLEPDDDTVKKEKKMVDELVSHGITIVSGLAKGCDAVAHRQTIESRGKTVAILPSPLHNILPVVNRDLARSILDENGLIVTEYLFDAPNKMAFLGRYQKRDRLQALYSQAIILTSSYAENDVNNDSGSRLAMRYAYEYGIPRAVMYDEKHDSNNIKFDLNRQVLLEDDQPYLINPNNLKEDISKLAHNTVFTNRVQEQEDLF